jgi:hypothetical protein
MHGARTIAVESKLGDEKHGTVLNEKLRLSPSSLPNADAPWKSIGQTRAMSAYELQCRPGTQTAPTR